MSELLKPAIVSSASPTCETPVELAEGSGDIYVDPALERLMISKFDRYMMPQMALLVLLAYLDRSNIGTFVLIHQSWKSAKALLGNARVFGFEEDLKLKGTQFGNISTLFYPTYVVFEVPWVMAVKKWGPNTILAIAMVAWSAVTLGTGFVHNYHQAIAVRLLLGAFESALFPCLVFVVSTIYTREQQGKRIAALYGATALSGAFGGLIAYAIQLMGAKHGLAAWRWLFIVEGCVSLGFGLALWLTLPSSPESAWFLTKSEKMVMGARLARDAAYRGEKRFSWSFVKTALSDPLIYIAALALFCSSIPLFGFGTFLPTIIVGLG
jgi:MFS family permease